jgi:hypothetical protein
MQADPSMASYVRSDPGLSAAPRYVAFESAPWPTGGRNVTTVALAAKDTKTVGHAGQGDGLEALTLVLH